MPTMATTLLSKFSISLPKKSKRERNDSHPSEPCMIVLLQFYDTLLNIPQRASIYPAHHPPAGFTIFSYPHGQGCAQGVQMQWNWGFGLGLGLQMNLLSGFFSKHALISKGQGA